MNTGRAELAGAGTNTSSLAFGGETTANTAATEEWNAGINLGAWYTGGNLNDSRQSLGGAGTQTAALAYGGDSPADTANTENYNGTSWSEVNNLNTARGAGGNRGRFAYLQMDRGSKYSIM